MMITVSLIIILAGCQTIEVTGHEAVGCEEMPNAEHNFTHEEKANMTDGTKFKIRKVAVILRQRINSQCEINSDHDKLHNN